ncbi:MAG TPA: acetyl-CoA C-acyltransferase, partial [Candidatus Dormibacteraeota bacterium]|nr:acetyl-CoA C-acyltransferase [Candidatus Dormibacteraeota bacterium]
MPEAVIVAAARTPIGRASKGSLVDLRPDEMAGFIVARVMERLPQLPPAEVDDLICGCGYPQGEAGMNVARLAGLLSGLPFSVPATTVNRFCASSLQAIRMAFHAIRAGEGETYVCAGVESVSRVRRIPTEAEKNPRLLVEGAFDTFAGAACGVPGYMAMGMTAEIVAERHDVSRADMDEYALRSQRRAAAARDGGVFDREIVPLATPGGAVVDSDDGIRADTTLEKLASLAPVFKEDGRVTAGNACPLNDGAAAVVVMSDEKARRLGITPLARILASSVSGLDPRVMGVGPIEA